MQMWEQHVLLLHFFNFMVVKSRSRVYNKISYGLDCYENVKTKVRYKNPMKNSVPERKVVVLCVQMILTVADDVKQLMALMCPLDCVP